MQKYSEYVKRLVKIAGMFFIDNKEFVFFERPANSKDAGRAMQNNRNLSIRSSAEQKN